MYKNLKRFLDIVFSLGCLVFFSPLFLIFSLVIMLRMGFPIIFKQNRPGLHGIPFVIYKFRTMKEKCNGDGALLDDAARLTNLGNFLRKTSMDELPELFNVLIGDMSFVGPRPLLMEYLLLYTPEQRRRHDVKPGITGWAQVNGRNAITWEEKFKLDTWYVDNQSFLLDMKILYMTIHKVFKMEGIHERGHATMTKFSG